MFYTPWQINLSSLAPNLIDNFSPFYRFFTIKPPISRRLYGGRYKASLAALAFNGSSVDYFIILLFRNQAYALSSLAPNLTDKFSPFYRFPFTIKPPIARRLYGGRYKARTCDPLNVVQVRYQLRQSPLFNFPCALFRKLSFPWSALPLSKKQFTGLFFVGRVPNSPI